MGGKGQSITSPLPFRRILAAAGLALALLVTPAGAAPAAWTGVTWSTTFPQQYGLTEAQGLALDGKLYSFGGYHVSPASTPTARAYSMDPATGWTALAPMPAQNGTNFGGVTHAGMATDGTYIYWAGGHTADATGTGQIFGTKEVWRYDPATNTYSRMPDLPLTRAAGQLAYVDGKLHYFGGMNLERTADVGEHWALDVSNPDAGWVTLAALPNPRNHMGAAVLDGKIYAVGGQHAYEAQLKTQNDVHAYDPVTDVWTQRADLPKSFGHISSSTFAMDGRVVVLGGETAFNVAIADSYAFDPDTNQWTALTALPSPRRSGVADAIARVMYYTTGATGRTTTTFKGVPDLSPPWPKRFNFQPAGTPAPATYTVDSGLGYDAGRGFGWVREDSLDSATHTALAISPNARDRNLVADQRLDTLLCMQFPSSVSNSTAVKTPAAWELAVPDGTYAVTVSVGDAGYLDSTHRINVEGQPAIAPFAPASGNRFASTTKTVTVSDGRLTVDAKGGTNTKINYVEIAQLAVDTTAPDAPTDLTATPGNAQVTLNWTASTASDLAGYRIYRSTSTPVPLDNPINGPALITGTAFTDTTADSDTTYHYVIVAVDTSANASSPSASASATPAPPDTTAPEAPTDLTATPGNAQVTLNWTASTASDLAGYRIYRGTSTPVPLDNPINGSTLITGTAFADTTAQNGTTYHYVMVAVDASANTSDPTPAASAKPQAPFDLKVNFQPSAVTVPTGYTKDSGLAYTAARGFGWVRQDSLSAVSHVGLDISPNSRDRNLHSDQRLDTLIHMQYPPSSAATGVIKTPAAWEAAVPNGTYDVTVSVGDAAPNFDSKHRIRLEGAIAVAGFVPTSANRFAQAMQRVAVSDGRLTVDAIGGTNTKINFVTAKTATTGATVRAAGAASTSPASFARRSAAVAQYVCDLPSASTAGIGVSLPRR